MNRKNQLWYLEQRAVHFKDNLSTFRSLVFALLLHSAMA